MSLAWTCMFKLLETGLKMCQRLYITKKNRLSIIRIYSDSPKLIVSNELDTGLGQRPYSSH